MTVFFDTSVLVPALVDQLRNHPAALDVFVNYTSNGNRGITSTHALAECFSVLTSLPLPRRVTPAEARTLIEETIGARTTVVALGEDDYLIAIARIAQRGLAGGIVYDALHAGVAERAGCSRLYTYNVDHLKLVCDEAVVVSAP